MYQIPEDVMEVLTKLRSAGREAYCVGGCVRDLLLGRRPGDWDVTTSALPEETMALFGDRAVPTGLRHGTVTVRTEQRPVEITTYRCDGVYADHRHPEQVTFTRSLEEDLRRRDFTVNAMALSETGEVRDPFGGREDLEGKMLRCVGDPDRRFDEDALRMLRGLRFAAVLDFAVHPATADSIRRNATLLKEVAAERIRVELEKLLVGPGAARVLRQFPEVVGVFLPEVLPAVGFDQRNPHHCYDVWEHTLHSVEAAPPVVVLRMTMLLHDLGKPACFTVDEAGVGHFYGHHTVSRRMAETILDRLRFDHDRKQTIVTLVDHHDRLLPPEEKTLRRALRKFGERDLRRLLAVKRADNLAQAPAWRHRLQELDAAEALLEDLLRQEACFSLKQLAVNGRDLLALGLRGPAVGRGLERLLDAVVDGTLENQPEVLLEAVKEWKNGPREDAVGKIDEKPL
ncbi:CCA tRNA nucleotidyltransferase [Dysosmobacter sp.]|uniref:CCA tRNA nucleotidyltransferase n=1 Tax=Dysosmobacter sp. TaxID=2591382 RepID=UPI002A85851B|nr:HD domain-containing protein [Dysosmobacter sp.]MDY3281371.1 HD domain-containing protein [Dysosmobacter sp.]